MARDEHDDEHPFGQNVREAFTQGDVYVANQPAADLWTKREIHLWRLT